MQWVLPHRVVALRLGQAKPYLFGLEPHLAQGAREGVIELRTKALRQMLLAVGFADVMKRPGCQVSGILIALLPRILASPARAGAIEQLLESLGRALAQGQACRRARQP